MPKKTNKGDRIRAAVEANPEATPEQVVEGLAEQGVEVTLAYVRKIGFPAIEDPENQQTTDTTPEPGEPPLRSVCRVCQSATFDYRHKKTVRHFGTKDGDPYNRVTWRRGRCEDCGSWDTHKFWHWEDEPEPEPVAESEEEPEPPSA